MGELPAFKGRTEQGARNMKETEEETEEETEDEPPGR